MIAFHLGRVCLGLVLALLTVAIAQPKAADTSDGQRDDRLQMAIETLQRLKGVDLESNPSLKAAVLKVLPATRGTPQFVELIRDFKIKGQNDALLEYAMRHPKEAAGVEALRLVLDTGELALIANSLNGTNAAPLLQALANATDKQAAQLIEPLVIDGDRAWPLRKLAIHALAQTQHGAEFLLEFALANSQSADLKNAIGSELRNARWPGVKASAAALLSAVEAPRETPVQSIPELVRMKGDPARGAEVFRRETAGCSQCHQVNGAGIDFGPNLSEIGTKLAKEAIYEAILDPSAGISFGYEAWQLELRNGEEPFGLLASETADELAIKAQSGIVSRYKKTDIASRMQQKSSIMPSGLPQVMSQQDLVDLVEYLASLRKPTFQIP